MNIKHSYSLSCITLVISLFFFTHISVNLLTPKVSPAAGSTTPFAVHFEVPTVVDEGPDFGKGNFTATGEAVDAGIVCPTGDVIHVYFKATGYQSGTVQIIQIIKRFICDDGSGDFDVKLQVRLDQSGDHFTWDILGGTGAYANLNGTGSGIGTEAAVDELVLDIYDGSLLIE